MIMFKLNSNFKPSGDQPEAIKKLIKGIEKGDKFQTLLGVTGSGKTFTMANIISYFNKPVLVMAPNKTLAAQLYREYKNFFPENSVNYFVSYYDYYQPEAYMPITDTYIGKESMINEEIDKLRHKATSALLSRKDVIVVASVSCIYNLGLPSKYLKAALHIEINKPITRGDLIRQLVKMHFKRTQGVLKRGFFRVRGDVFEIAPASGDLIFKIEIKNQKISSIFALEELTLKINKKLEDLAIFPVKHFVSTEPVREKAIIEIKKELKERLDFFNKNKLFLEAERLERRTCYDIEMIKSIGYCHGVENYSRHLSGKLAGDPPDTLLSYFGRPEDFLLIIDESHISIPQINGMYEGDRKRKNILVEYGFRLPSALDNRPLKFKEFEKRIGQTIFTSATPGLWEFEKSSQVVEQIIRPTGLIDPPVEIRPVFDKKKNTSQIDDIMSETKNIVAGGGRVIINTLTKKMAEDLSDFLVKKGFKNRWMHSETKTLERTRILTGFRQGEFDVLVGVNLLREGLDLPEVTLVAILDADREGFLRSETSLVQIMGRCARNVDGKVIVYADKITGSIKKAVKEMERRRKIQSEYNKKHKIIPQTIKKKVEQLIDLD
ncbi:excinuclease ABC subunit UvrB [Candidatus Wolfebacteria bacterium]|nr:excinuclease ABC subunit UvrB [Candidatus Wolfebacteria bacterium]